MQEGMKYVDGVGGAGAGAERALAEYRSSTNKLTIRGIPDG